MVHQFAIIHSNFESKSKITVKITGLRFECGDLDMQIKNLSENRIQNIILKNKWNRSQYSDFDPQLFPKPCNDDAGDDVADAKDEDEDVDRPPQPGNVLVSLDKRTGQFFDNFKMTQRLSNLFLDRSVFEADSFQMCSSPKKKLLYKKTCFFLQNVQ